MNSSQTVFAAFNAVPESDHEAIDPKIVTNVEKKSSASDCVFSVWLREAEK
jgi:hypothetical protein